MAPSYGMLLKRVLIYLGFGYTTLAWNFAAPPPAYIKSPPQRPGQVRHTQVTSTIQRLPSQITNPRVLLGIDVLQQHQFQELFWDSGRKKPKRIGLLCNVASIDSKGVSTLRILKNAPGVNLVALFIAENGFDGTMQNGKFLHNSYDPIHQIPVYSLHGKTRAPTPEMLVKIDTLVIDLQDIGCRSYTFISAMRFALEAVFNAGKEAIVLDRPNPLGGIQMDGPIMEDDYISYAGAFRIPYIHGLTMGELAQLVKIDNGHPRFKHFSQEKRRKGKLTVIRMQGWQRWMLWKDTGLPWIPPSKSIRTPQSAAMYAIVGFGCLGTRFSHGARSPFPFQVLRYLDPHPTIHELFQHLQHLHLNDFVFKESNRGVYVQLKSWNHVRPMRFALQLMQFSKQWTQKNLFQQLATSRKSYISRTIGSKAFLQELASPRKTIQMNYFLNQWRLDCERFRSYLKKNACILY